MVNKTWLKAAYRVIDIKYINTNVDCNLPKAEPHPSSSIPN